MSETLCQNDSAGPLMSVLLTNMSVLFDVVLSFLMDGMTVKRKPGECQNEDQCEMPLVLSTTQQEIDQELYCPSRFLRHFLPLLLPRQEGTCCEDSSLTNQRPCDKT